MTAVNASTLGDENVENSKKLQQAVVSKKEVAADGTVTLGNTPALSTAIDKANTAVKEALEQTTKGQKKYSKTELDTAITKAKTEIGEVLKDKNISKAANEAFTTLQDKLDNLTTLNNAANDGGKLEDVPKLDELNALKTGLEDFGTALQDAFNLTNSQMTSLDELRTTLQGFVAKPNEVNLDHTSFTTFLDVA